MMPFGVGIYTQFSRQKGQLLQEIDRLIPSEKPYAAVYYSSKLANPSRSA